MQAEELRARLKQIHSRSYPAYKQIKGKYQFQDFELEVVHVQGDPFAAPSRIAIHISAEKVTNQSFPISNLSRRIGWEDGILRTFSNTLRNFGMSRGSGKSGRWEIVRLGQEMLPRTACEIDSGTLILRFTLGLPAAGRRILGFEAIEMFFEELPAMIKKGVLEADQLIWERHAKSMEDQDALRKMLLQKTWVAFIADESVLPRASGIDDQPLIEGARPWKSPAELGVEIELPNAGKVSGTAISEGVTIICGGGYHGKSTLLHALSRGVYNHVPGDGRDSCVAIYDAVMVRAEDGRSVSSVDISTFIGKLPDGRDTKTFQSSNASGSTSQAANIVEAIEMGVQCFLIDEDTSATNFMVRDRRMQELVPTHKEPISPFIDRVRELYEKHKISSVLVIGGSGDYFEVADTVIVMDEYLPRVETSRARDISTCYPSNRLEESRPPLQFDLVRVPLKRSFDPRRGQRPERVQTRETRTIIFGRNEIEVSLVPQLIDHGQTRTIGDWLLLCSRELADENRSVRDICDVLEEEAFTKPLSQTIIANDGDRVFARRYELAAAINRLRTLQIANKSDRKT